MTYYEELGLDRTAAPEEIRMAYRRAARLLHPDRNSRDLRTAAELQMRRLNEVLKTLTDPRCRSEYDRIVSSGASPEAPSREEGRPLSSWWQSARIALAVWSATIAVAICSLILYFREDYGFRPALPQTARQQEAAGTGSDAEMDRRVQRLELRTERLERALSRVARDRSWPPRRGSDSP